MVKKFKWIFKNDMKYHTQPFLTRKEEIDVSAREAQQTKERTRKRNGEHSCTDKEPRTKSVLP
jgi:hypothetical protein